MRILAIDPGVTTGVAHYNSRTKRIIAHFQTKNPMEVIEYMERLHKSGTVDIVVIEDFIGYGRRDAAVIKTIKNLGFFEGFAHALKLEVQIQQPQMRKAFLSRATEMVGAEMHYTDATAHALAFCYFHAQRTGGLPDAIAQSD